MKNGFIGIIASAALVLASTVSAKRITAVQKTDGILASQGFGLGLGGLSATVTAGVLAGAIIGVVAVTGGFSGGGSAAQTP